MLKSLSVLPKELKDEIRILVNRPEFVKFIDMAEFNENGMFGGCYVVMNEDAQLWKPEFAEPRRRAFDYLAERWEDSYDTTDGVRTTTESWPLCWSKDIDAFTEGEDYRVLTREQVLEELE